MTASKAGTEAEIRQFPSAKHGAIEQPAAFDAPQQAPSEAVQAPAPVAAPVKKGGTKKFVFMGLGLVALGAGLWYGYEWWTTGRFMVSTDDAYVQGDISSVAPKVTGYIESIPVSANQRVKAGDVLFQLDSGDYKLALEAAEAKLATQKQSLQTILAQTDAAKAAVQQAEAEKQAALAVLKNAQNTMARVTKLHDTSFAAQSELDTAQSNLDQAQAKSSGADAQIVSARANIEVLQAQYKEAETTIRSLELSRDQATRDLSFTTLRAPFDGVVGNLSGKTGDLVSAGQKIAALVPVQQLYIEANFKETQLAHIKGGETVHIAVDAIDGPTVEGKVTSIAPASGAVFSLLPPENATGNFTKVVQRVPVRISIPQEALDSGKIRAGLSVTVDIDTRTAPEHSTN